jgi:hypothetical protein
MTVLTEGQYRDQNACWECGKQPSRKEYVAYLKEALEEAQRVLAMSPEERAAYEERKNSFASWVDSDLVEDIHHGNEILNQNFFRFSRGSTPISYRFPHEEDSER